MSREMSSGPFHDWIQLCPLHDRKCLHCLQWHERIKLLRQLMRATAALWSAFCFQNAKTKVRLRRPGHVLTLFASALATSLFSFLLYDTHQGSGRGEGFRTGPGQSLNHCGWIAYHQSKISVHHMQVLATRTNVISELLLCHASRYCYYSC